MSGEPLTYRCDGAYYLGVAHLCTHFFPEEKTAFFTQIKMNFHFSMKCSLNNNILSKLSYAYNHDFTTAAQLCCCSVVFIKFK